MKFSIIIPVYNVETYIKKCVNSILIQSYKDYEIILVDDGSPDKSGTICDEYTIKDNRVKVVHKKNGGLSSARNTGLDIAKGEYIIFLDSDDWWDNDNGLSIINNKLLEKECDILIFGMKKYFTFSDNFGDERPPSLEQGQDITIKNLMCNNIYTACACNKVIRREFIEKQKLRFTIGQLSEDIEWCAKLLLTNPKINILSECFYVYRQQNSNSITSNITRKNVEHVLDIIERLSESPSIPLKHYLANQLVLLMAFSRKVKTTEIIDLLKRAQDYWWLTNYNWYPYVRKISRIRFLGFNKIRFLLGIYHKYRRG